MGLWARGLPRRLNAPSAVIVAFAGAWMWRKSGLSRAFCPESRTAGRTELYGEKFFVDHNAASGLMEPDNLFRLLD